MSMSVGLGNGKKPASAAAATMKMVQAIAAQNSHPSRRDGVAGLSATCSSMLSSSVAMAYPGIENGIEHVDNKIHQHEPSGDEQHHSLQNDQIPGVDGRNEQPANSRQGEDGLNDQRPADQAADVDSGDRDQGER